VSRGVGLTKTGTRRSRRQRSCDCGGLTLAPACRQTNRWRTQVDDGRIVHMEVTDKQRAIEALRARPSTPRSTPSSWLHREDRRGFANRTHGARIPRRGQETVPVVRWCSTEQARADLAAIARSSVKTRLTTRRSSSPRLAATDRLVLFPNLAGLFQNSKIRWSARSCIRPIGLSTDWWEVDEFHADGS
jgi:hypothetical protein